MKKTIFALLALGLFTQTTHAQSLSCSPQNTLAVDKYGTCRIYSNPCQVPTTWRVLPVDSCDDVESDETGETTKTVANRRIDLITRAKRQRAAENEDTTVRTNYSKSGKALYTRRNTQNYEEANTSVKQSNKRTFRSSLGSFNLKIRAYGEDREKLTEEKTTQYESQGLRRPAVISNIGRDREGKLTNEPSYLERQAQRYAGSSRRLSGRSPYWQSIQQIAADKKEEKEYTRRPITLRKTFRGYQAERRNATLNNVTNRSEETSTSEE